MPSNEENEDSAPKLIAHRGGVVDKQHPENSLAALEEAIRRGYWMVEVDVRQSKDGVPVAQHDRRLRRLYGAGGRVDDLTWNELRKLQSRVDSQPPCSLAELASHCRGRTRLMLDAKVEESPDGFFDWVERILLENDLLDSAFFIGSAAQKAYFRGKARVAASRATIERSAAASEPVSSLYFLFAHGRVLDEETIRCARSLDVPVVASVNRLHYIIRFGRATPESDIRRLRKLGVEHYQIDSDFESFFTEKT